jgi:DNA-binding CsgD family transcriptional regulator
MIKVGYNGYCLVAEIRTFLAKPDIDTSSRRTLPLDDLTPRERAVLEGIADGLDNAEIATALGLSEKTVRNHITRVFDKIQVEHSGRGRATAPLHVRGAACPSLCGWGLRKPRLRLHRRFSPRARPLSCYGLPMRPPRHRVEE